jgi:hypothetical protein
MRMMRSAKIAVVLFALVGTLGFTKSALADINDSVLGGLINTVSNLSNRNYIYNPYLNNYSYYSNNYSYQIAKRNYYLAQRERIEQERLIAQQIRAERYEHKFRGYRDKRHERKGFNYFR